MNNRKSRTKITPELIQKLKELVEAGKSNKEISEILDIGTTTITTYKKKYNIKYIKKTAEDYKEEIIKMYTSGYSTKDIAEYFGYKSQTTIKNILNSENIRSNREIEYEELKNKIKNICPNCISVYEASKKVGCSPTTIRKYLKEFNISLRLKYELTDEDIKEIQLEPLKYELDTPLDMIPKSDRKEFLESKIKRIILSNRKYTGVLVLKHHNIDTNLLSKYSISTEELNTELGLKRVNGSSLELYFSEFCELHSISFESQKSFNDCVYKEELRFDYYLPEYNTLIEIQGKQHYKPVEKFGGVEAFEEGQIRDKIKQEWCKENNVKLIYISYRDLYKNNFLENLFKAEIFPIAKYKSDELLETPEVDNQQPS